MPEQTKASWQKCKDCEFLVRISASYEIGYVCSITKEKFYLVSCVKNEHEMEHL